MADRVGEQVVEHALEVVGCAQHRRHLAADGRFEADPLGARLRFEPPHALPDDAVDVGLLDAAGQDPGVDAGQLEQAVHEPRQRPHLDCQRGHVLGG